MMTPIIHGTAEDAWSALAREIISKGHDIAPRDQPTLEVLSAHAAFEMGYPVITSQSRKMSYTGMAAEALWIAGGSDRLADIEPWLPRYAEFSDDGVTLWGAYGPRIDSQMDSVVKKLVADRSTRQAVLTTWRPNPSPTRDVPCTIGFTFQIRGARLHCHVHMRSSDVYLGFPYDAFAFTMVAAKVATMVNQRFLETGADLVGLGALFYTADSCHVYKRDIDALKKAAFLDRQRRTADPIPDHLIAKGHLGWADIKASLLHCRGDVRIQDVPWRIRPY